MIFKFKKMFLVSQEKSSKRLKIRLYCPVPKGFLGELQSLLDKYYNS